MGWLCSGLMFPMGCLILMWAAGSGSVKVLSEPTCFSDFVTTSTCEWKMAGPVNCSTELLLSYELMSFQKIPDTFESRTCVPENKDGAVCVCSMIVDIIYSVDVYTLKLWAGQQLLWKDIFQPCHHVKPRAPENLTVHKNASDMLLLRWGNPYAPADLLYSELTYLVNISNENDPSDFVVQEVIYKEPFLYLPASSLKSGVFYRASVKAQSQEYNSTWSEWSRSNTWYNYYEKPLVQRLPLGISISCIVILATCLSSYFIIIKIKKEWWDQIPNPAHSPLIAIIIQDSQVSLWGKPSRGQKPVKCPRWKTCLTKLLPCFLEHNKEKDEDSPKAAKHGPSQGPGKLARSPAELSKTVLWPESINVVRCVELFEAQVEGEEEEVEEDKGSSCPSPENSGVSFQEGREGIAARMTESLFLDLLGGQDGVFSPQGLGESLLSPLSGSGNTQMPWAEFPSTEPKEAALQGGEPESTSLASTELPAVMEDNPTYRSLSTFLSQSPGSGELDSDPLLAACLGEADSQTPCASQPLEEPTSLQPELETWEQILRRSVLQHGAVPAPTSAPASGAAQAPASATISGYREFVSAMKQGSTQDGQTVGLSSPGESGYKAFSSLLANSTACLGISGVEASSGEGGYKPFQNLLTDCPEASGPGPVPQFTFGLDMEPPHTPQGSLFPSTSPEHLSLGPVLKGEDSQKPLLPTEQAMDPLRDDLGSGIVYSALTCHLCGHLKQCHSQEEHGEAHAVAGPCCGCCCGDRSSPLVSPLRAPDPLPGELQLEANLSPACLAPLGVSEENKSSLSFQPLLSNAQSSDQPAKMVAMASTEPSRMRVT
ncbi:interleukin-4 receptor subunit alpha isoform X1 [Elephas maximus indicus]|uniref:interleukin-4 receptor subunit alpha isoform X1 n=1 Tax=Elephas maximus indicus TaxID=99487 RepID=UPI0021172BE8|nr:interleukin-4 receptor subunit alpha isoform X1 [Elephas maximus indicus]XP_049759008.1 interleukin-4 receptor subunit alpha isoform X1 [Elephas maximus indicus]XP_049759009.1 interleukin-4 receptor subunit alpha isoform X1 [Elephas maximus indicus]XP_049759010.1 interleukin-4 receptor subunit alpha isoform X1 [Elephas maximus indicus]XP_049759011.1 interleukin-4 receptor subunit alpha isoform X1 [Elephas maximus indicus]XP_049759012.1 interleukin-4 receptor subunit alpha isoform X1 [Elepha